MRFEKVDNRKHLGFMEFKHSNSVNLLNGRLLKFLSISVHVPSFVVVCLHFQKPPRNRPLVPFLEYESLDCTFFHNMFPYIERREVTIGGRRAEVEERKIGKKVLSNFTNYDKFN